MNQKEIIEAFEKVELKTDLNSLELTVLEQTVTSKGFALFLGLMLGTRQSLLVALANSDLGDAQKSCRASVLQGQIMGLELARSMVVELFPVAGDGQDNGQ